MLSASAPGQRTYKSQRDGCHGLCWRTARATHRRGSSLTFGKKMNPLLENACEVAGLMVTPDPKDSDRALTSVRAGLELPVALKVLPEPQSVLIFVTLPWEVAAIREAEVSQLLLRLNTTTALGAFGYAPVVKKVWYRASFFYERVIDGMMLLSVVTGSAAVVAEWHRCISYTITHDVDHMTAIRDSLECEPHKDRSYLP